MTRMLTGTVPPRAATPPEAVPPAGSLKDLCEILFRYLNKMVIFFAAVMLTAMVFLSQMQHTYTSEAKILVRRGRENILLDPTVATGEVTPLFMDWENNMNSEIEILTSRQLAAQVVQAIGPGRFLGAPAPGEPEAAARSPGALGWLKEAGSRLRELRPAPSAGPAETLDRELELSRAALAFTRSLTVKVIPKSNIIAISFDGGDPVLARLVVETLLDEYHKMHILANRAPGAHEFFLRETEALRGQLERAEEALRELKDTSGIQSIETQRTILLNRVGELRNQLEQTAGQVAASLARVKAGEEAVRKESAGDVKVASLLPTVTYRDARSELRAEETALAGLKAQSEIVQAQLAQAQGEMKGLNELEIKLARMERERDMLKDKYTKYCQNLEQTRIDQALQTEKISNISVIQPPTTPAYPNPLNRSIKLVMAFMVASVGSVGIAFMGNHFDHSLKKPEDLEEALQLPTLVSIPRLRARGFFWFARREGGPGSEGRSFAFLQGRRYYGMLRDRIQMMAPRGERDGSMVIGITSSHSGEGVSSVASNLAIAFAESSRNDRVLLVDANRDRPSPHAVFGIKKAPGAAEISTDVEGRLIIVEQNLYEVPNGDEEPDRPTGTLAVYYNSLLRLVRDRQYRFVIFDMPPLSEGSALQLARLMDGVILVVKAEGVRGEIVQRMKNLLQEIDARILGTVLNKRRFYIPGWLYRRL